MQGICAFAQKTETKKIVLFMNLCLIGSGLIGASAAWAMKNAGVFDRVRVFDLSQQSAVKACEMGIADEACGSIEKALEGADAVMAAVPVLAMESVFSEIGKYAPPCAYITDVGSTRTAVIDAASRTLADKFCNYAPVHPIAGGEMPGVEYARADLFERARAISTPEPGMGQEAVCFWEHAWAAAGAVVVRMSAAEHDEIFASVSHLPHVLSYAMVDSILQTGHAERKLSFAGAGFRDFTRIAASSPRMWTDICIANRDAILSSMDAFEKDLAALRRIIENKDEKGLMEVFGRASRSRRALFPSRPPVVVGNGKN